MKGDLVDRNRVVATVSDPTRPQQDLWLNLPVNRVAGDRTALHLPTNFLA